MRVEGAFQQTLETALILAFANPIFHFHRPTPLSRASCATRFVTIIGVGRKDRTVPLGLAKKRSRWSSHYAHGLEDWCVGNQAALVIKISVLLNMQRKACSWEGARRCTSCDSVTVRPARRRTAKTSGYRVALSSRCCRPYGTRLQMIAVLEISADHRLHASLIDRITARLPEDFAA